MIRKPLLVILGLSVSAILASFAFTLSPAHSANAGDWKAGSIIDDSIFFSGNSMSVQDIQNFLNGQLPVCDTWGTKMYSATQTRAQYGVSVGTPPPYICVKDYYENPTTHQTNFNPTASVPEGGLSAAQIIYNVSTAFNINPRVLLVTLKKEAPLNLISDDWPMLWEYRTAMGYGCPDTAPCDAQYYGFYNQMYNAAKQFRLYATYPESYRYKAGQNNFIQYNPNASCSGTYVFIQNQATAGLYSYTPYQPNAAALNNLYGTGDSCSAYGNRNFWRIYTDWFGDTRVPSAFKKASNGTVYISASGYKFTVPSIALLQDYGINPAAIQVLPDSTIDAIPNPDTASGLSQSIGYLVKSASDQDEDGGTVYLISIGKKYPITSLEQFARYGFDTGNLSLLPMTFLKSIETGNVLSDYTQTPNGTIYKIDQGKKHVIFSYSDFIKYNPSGSFNILSWASANLTPSGNPATSSPIFIRTTSDASVYLFSDDTYYPITTMAIYSCWGVDTSIGPLRIVDDAMIAKPTANGNPLQCTVSDGQQTLLLARDQKFTAPELSPSFVLTPNIITYTDKVPTRNLPSVVKSESSSTIWYIEEGKKRGIPSMNAYSLLGITGYDTINSPAIDTIPSNGVKLAVGQVVKSPQVGTIYIVTSPNTKTPISYSDDFNALHYDWNRIDVITQGDLDKYTTTPSTYSRFVVDKSASKSYLVDYLGCYDISSKLAAFGKDLSSLIANQPYDITIFPYLKPSGCQSMPSLFVKSPSSSTVYWLKDGKKSPVSSWQALISLNNNNPNISIVTLSASTLSLVETSSSSI